MMSRVEHLSLFGMVCIATWVVITYLWPRLLMSVYKRGILVDGFGDGPIPVNTLSTEPQALFADPLHPPPSASKFLTTGVNCDTLVTAGWLDLSNGPLVLHVPAMNERYYSMQFTDPSKNTNFAYVGTRATGPLAGDYLIVGRGWKGLVPDGMTQISSPNNSVLLLGRVLVKNDCDLATAYSLSTQIQLMPLLYWQPKR